MSKLNIQNPLKTSQCFIKIQTTNHIWREPFVPASPFIFSDVTEEELNKSLESHYNGNINMADYWSVGDIYTSNYIDHPLFQVKKHLCNIYNYVNSYSTNGQIPVQATIKWVIIGLNHDDLVNEINGINKAAITIQTLGIISQAKNNSIQIAMDYEFNRSTNTNGWAFTPLRRYLNNTFKDACNFKKYIKTVKKPTCLTTQSSTITLVEDDIFLLSYNEVYGNYYFNEDRSYFPYGTEGIQYSYFPINSFNSERTGKNQGWEGTGSSIRYWLRSHFPSNTTSYLCVEQGGYKNWSSSGTTIGVPPACCL